MNSNRRRLRMARPRLQLRLIYGFLGIAAIALLLQYTLFVLVLTNTAVNPASDGVVLLEIVGQRVLLVLVVSFILLLPITMIVGILATHRIAGPIFRFEKYLQEVIAGETTDECQLRSGDELHELCGLINRSTALIRARSGIRPSLQDASLDDHEAA